MMIRAITASAASLAIAITGCQSSHRTHAAGSAALLEQRLASIEQARLEQIRSSSGDAAAAMNDTAVLVRANRPAPRHVCEAIRAPGLESTRDPGLGGGAPTNSTIPHPAARPEDLWAMTDIGDQQVLDDTQTETEYSAYDPERESTYVRRPPLDSFWETAKRDVRDMPADLWRDTKRVYANPTNLIILGTAYGGSLALQESGPDDSIEDHFRHGHDHFDGGWSDAFGAAGNPATHLGLAGLWYLVGQQTGDEKTYEVGKTLFSALIINGLTTMVGQAATWDRAPNGEWGTFPSGHTSSSFATASVLHEAYGHAVGIPLYGLATLVAIERVDDDEHYFSDVMMGAVLGTVVGHSVASGRDPEFFGWKVLPYAHPEGGTGLAFVKTLP